VRTFGTIEQSLILLLDRVTVNLHLSVLTTSDYVKVDFLALDKLPRAKEAGYLSEPHQPCLAGTRKAELQRIEQWAVDYTNKRVYWLNGNAGSGKSTIAQTFAERSFAEGRLGASFFCSRDFPDRRNIRLIFPTLAYGLAYLHTQFRERLLQTLSSNPNVAYESLANQLESLLVLPLKSTNLSTTIIIDALDECEDNQPASAILSLLARHTDTIPFVKFFITGRPEVPIRSGFRLPLLRPHTEVFLLHEVDSESVDKDIELYLRTRFSEIVAARSDWDVTVLWPSDEEISAAVKKCSGHFIVAFVIVRFVGARHHEPRERLKAILSRPDSTVHEGKSGIDETYHQVLTGCDWSLGRSCWCSSLYRVQSLRRYLVSHQGEYGMPSVLSTLYSGFRARTQKSYESAINHLLIFSPTRADAKIRDSTSILPFYI